jgi:signal transduction histidine kinase/ActR/RegA family two-component response regulator
MACAIGALAGETIWAGPLAGRDAKWHKIAGSTPSRRVVRAPMRSLLAVATMLQVAAVAYCALLLLRHRNAAAAWLCLLGTLLSMLVWRIVMTTGATPGIVFNTSIAISGSVFAVLAMFFFASEAIRRERAEAERDRLLASEREARSQAERANRIKDDFMATLSHELRSPLAAMLGWCTILRSAKAPAEAARAIDTIERNARVQTRLVDDLLDAMRMQAGSLHLELAPVSLDVPVTAALEAIGPSAKAKQLRIGYECAQPAPVVMGDASRLQQIASNLLVNAVKFTPEGRTVDVRLASVGGHAELIVSDRGIGIEPAFIPQLFQRFRQAEGGDARRHGGLGLGLSIVSSLAHLHQGTVHATSDGPGDGATFTVRLPLSTRAPSALQGDARRIVPTIHTAQLLDGLRVLVVDDEADVRGAVAGLLERSGALVLSLESGAGIEAAMAEFRPDVLVLDIGLPGEDGYTLIRRIRGLSAIGGSEVPAISLTAHARDEDRQHAIDSGFHAHLPKPIDVPLLLSTIRTLVDDHRTTAQEAAIAIGSASEEPAIGGRQIR